jgi:hypothetical protein
MSDPPAIIQVLDKKERSRKCLANSTKPLKGIFKFSMREVQIPALTIVSQMREVILSQMEKLP